MRLRHLVFIELKEDDEKIQLVNQSLKKLSQKMQGCIGFGFNKCEGNNAYHYFFMDFDSSNSRDHYLSHPEHEQLAGNVIIPQLKNGLNSVIVFDYEKEDRKSVSKMEKSQRTSGYILINHEQLSDVERKLAEYADKINMTNKLENVSSESFAKYKIALRIKSDVIEPENISQNFREEISFWRPRKKATETERNDDDALIATSKIYSNKQ